MTDRSPAHTPPPGLLHKLDKIQSRIERSLNTVGGVLIFVMMVTVVAEVLSRAMFNTPITGQNDFIILVVPCAVFFGLAFCHNQGSQIRMTAVVQNFSGRSLWLAELVTTIASLGLFTFLSVATLMSAQRAFEMGDITMEVDFPTWPTKGIIALGVVLLTSRLVLQFFGFARLVHDPLGEPIAIPMSASRDALLEKRAEMAAASSEKE